MSLNFVSDERKLAFYRKTLIHNNAVLRTMMSLPAAYYNYLGLCHKYLTKDPYCSVSSIKRATCAMFALMYFCHNFLVFVCICYFVCGCTCCTIKNNNYSYNFTTV